MDEHIHWKKLDYNHDPTLLQMHTPEIVDSSTSTSTPPNPSASSPTKSTCLDKRNLRLPHLNLLSRYATRARHVQSHTTQRSTSDNTITINTKHPSRTCILNPQTNHRGHVRGKKRRNRAPRDDCNIPAVRHRVHLLSPFFRNRVPISSIIVMVDENPALESKTTGAEPAASVPATSPETTSTKAAAPEVASPAKEIEMTEIHVQKKVETVWVRTEDSLLDARPVQVDSGRPGRSDRVEEGRPV